MRFQLREVTRKSYSEVGGGGLTPVLCLGPRSVFCLSLVLPRIEKATMMQQALWRDSFCNEVAVAGRGVTP